MGATALASSLSLLPAVYSAAHTKVLPQSYYPCATNTVSEDLMVKETGRLAS